MRFTTGTLFFTLVLTVSCSQNRNTATNQQDAVEAVTSERVHLSNLATVMINDAREARDRLANGQQQAALDRVNDALRQWNEIQSRAKGQRYVPIYQEVETVSVWQPHAVVENGKATPIVPASRQPNQNAAPKPAVAGMAGTVTTISADVQITGDHLKAAQSALQSNNSKKAARELSAVQEAVVAQSVAGDLPLIRARQNLMLAENRARDKDWPGVHTALKQAASAFEEYANFPQNKRSSEARNVKQQIDSFASHVEQKNSGAGKKIQSWWDQTSDWIISPNQPSNQVARR